MQPALLDGVIGVERYETPGIYNGRGIVYRVDEVRYGVYPTREWAFPLGEMLGRLSVDRLGQRSVARAGAVYEPSVRRRAEYAWRGTVREFEEVNRGNRVLAAVHLEARLIRSSDGTPVWSGSRRLEREIPQPTMPAIVDALSELASQAVTELADSARLAISDGKTTGSTPRE